MLLGVLLLSKDGKCVQNALTYINIHFLITVTVLHRTAKIHDQQREGLSPVQAQSYTGEPAEKAPKSNEGKSTQKKKNLQNYF